MFSVKSLKKLSSGVLFSILVSVMQSSVGLSVESNIKEDNKGAVEISIKKTMQRKKTQKVDVFLKWFKENKNIILPVASTVLLGTGGAYALKKLYNSFYEEQLNESTNSSEKTDLVDEKEKSADENEVPKSNLNVDDAQNKEKNGQDGNESIQGNFTKENLPLSEGDTQGTSEKDALTDEKKQVANGSTDLPGNKDESSKEKGNEISQASKKEATSVLALLGNLLGKFLLVVLILNVISALIFVLWGAVRTVMVKMKAKEVDTWKKAFPIGFNKVFKDIKAIEVVLSRLF